MDSTFITEAVQSIWRAWNIRGFMILSLSMQIVLTLATPFRRKTSNGFVILVVWSTYFLSDWAAVFAFGLISNAGCRSSSNNKPEVAQDVMALWAAFLLIHLGGPDNITAFSLEDNALWLRHLVGLIAQLFAFLYIFVKTLPGNKLLVPTILIFMAGVIKYGERTRALYLASLENLKTSIKKAPDVDDVTDSRGEDDEAHFPPEIKPAFHFHKIFKGLFVDIMPSRSEWYESRQFLSQRDANQVFRLISIELKFLYEVFYTKIIAANSRLGVVIRTMAYASTLVAFILFCLADKDEFRRVDVAISYALLAGVFVLDVASIEMVAKSDWTYTNQSMYFILQVVVQGFLPYIAGSLVYLVVMFLVQNSAIELFIERQWSEKIGSFNLLSHCFKQCSLRKWQKPGFIWKKLAEIRSTSKELANPELWELIFKDLERKAAFDMDAERLRKVYEARGDWAIKESACREIMPFIRDFQYDNTLLIWHIATEICYNLDAGCTDEMIKYSKKLSDYMMYLLVKQPKMMSPIAGIGHMRYEDTCIEVKQLGRKVGAQTMEEFCALILQEDTSITEPTVEVKHSVHSVLNDARRLVRLIRGNIDRWEIIFNVWVELLTYAAGHCRADSHARLLSEGGEFITFVWMLMAHYGVCTQFPVK